MQIIAARRRLVMARRTCAASAAATSTARSDGFAPANRKERGDFSFCLVAFTIFACDLQVSVFN